jgi:hypothetical protein
VRGKCIEHAVTEHRKRMSSASSFFGRAFGVIRAPFDYVANRCRRSEVVLEEERMKEVLKRREDIEAIDANTKELRAELDKAYDLVQRQKSAMDAHVKKMEARSPKVIKDGRAMSVPSRSDLEELKTYRAKWMEAEHDAKYIKNRITSDLKRRAKFERQIEVLEDVKIERQMKRSAEVLPDAQELNSFGLSHAKWTSTQSRLLSNDLNGQIADSMRQVAINEVEQEVRNEIGGLQTGEAETDDTLSFFYSQLSAHSPLSALASAVQASGQSSTADEAANQPNFTLSVMYPTALPTATSSGV